MSVVVLLGLAGGVLAVVGPLPYLRDVVRGTTRPHRGAWLVWATLGCIAFGAQTAGGGGWSLLFLGIQATSMVLTAMLAVPRGEGGSSVREVVLLGVAGAGLVGWLVLDAPVVATCCVVLADGVGFALMLPKAWREPWSETASTYLLAALSGLCGAAALGEPTAALLVYPVYFALANLATWLLLVHRRRVVGSLADVATYAACGPTVTMEGRGSAPATMAASFAAS